MRYLMSIDAGTGSVRAVLFDELGTQVSIAQREWTHHGEEGVAASMSFDTRANWQLVCECINESLTKARIDPSHVAALTASSMREGIVLYDKEGNELWAVANVDARASAEVIELKLLSESIEEEFYRESGQTFALGALPRLLWVKKHRSDIYEKTATISMISDWVLARISGVIATDPSNGGTTGIFSLSSRDWQSSQARRVGLRDDIFPPVYEPGTVIGEITAECADKTLLPKGCKVVMGGGDVQLGSAGLGVIRAGQSAILGGSFWQQIVNIDAATPPPADMSLRVNPHVIPHLSQAEGITFFSGLIMRWFRDAFCSQQVLEAAKRNIDPYALLEELAAEVPVGSYGIMPIFSDAMSYGKWYHASPSFLNLSLDPERCNIASMFRSLQENAAIVSAINLENITAYSGMTGGSLTFAGGASKGWLWPQIVADVTGRQIDIPVVKEATSLGGAMVAGIAAGIYTDIEEAVSLLVRWERSVEPDMDNHRIYQDIKHKWQQVYANQLALVDRGLLESMWRAPGV